MDIDVANAAMTVGLNLKLYREAIGISQAELGRNLEPILGVPWSRQAASAAEKGQRAFAAAELVALAKLLGVEVADFFRQVEIPTPDEEQSPQRRLQAALGNRPPVSPRSSERQRGVND